MKTAQISPELVLVSPDLAERARAELPDRPWELFVPAPGPQPLRVVLPATPAPAPAARPRLASYIPGILLVVFIALIVIGSSPWVGDRPTLGPPPSRIAPPP